MSETRLMELRDKVHQAQYAFDLAKERMQQAGRLLDQAKDDYVDESLKQGFSQPPPTGFSQGGVLTEPRKLTDEERAVFIVK